MQHRLTLGERLGYGFGNFGINLPFGMANAFLLFFYTDVFGVSAATVGTVFLVARAVDAVFDPFMGLLIDRTETRLGKHRPYLIALAIPFAVSSMSLFAAPALGPTGKVAYIFVTYTLFGLFYSAVSLPLNSMLPTLTRDPRERNIANATREFMGSGAVVGVGYATMPLVGVLGHGSAMSGFLRLSGLFALVTVLALLTAFLTTRERVVPEASPQRLTTRQSLRTTRGNWPWIATMLVNFFFWVGFGGHVQSVVYYAQHVAGQAALVPDLMLTMVAMLVTIAASGWCANRFGKKPVGLVGGTIGAIATAMIPISTDPTWLIATNVVAYAGLGLIAGLLFALMADAVDYGEWRNGFRAPGFLFAASSFGVKLGMSVGGAAGAWLLAAAGYAAGAPITASVRSGITWAHVWFPAASYAAMAASLLLFTFAPEFHVANGARMKGNQDAI